MSCNRLIQLQTSSKKQVGFALSTMEAELIAGAKSVSECSWISVVLRTRLRLSNSFWNWCSLSSYKKHTFLLHVCGVDVNRLLVTSIESFCSTQRTLTLQLLTVWKTLSLHLYTFHSNKATSSGAAQHQNCSSIMVDNQSGIRTMNNEMVSAAAKHIALSYRFIKGETSKGRVSAKWCASKDQLADMLTKPLPRQTFEELRC